MKLEDLDKVATLRYERDQLLNGLKTLKSASYWELYCGQKSVECRRLNGAHYAELSESFRQLAIAEYQQAIKEREAKLAEYGVEV